MMKATKPTVLRRSRMPIEGLFCKYPYRACMQPRADGSEYCTRHVLEDKNGAFKQCSYISNKNGKRCPAAAPKIDKKEGYCLEHGRKSALMRQRASRKRRPNETPETLLEQIEHYGTKGDKLGRDNKRHRSSTENITNRILDYASSTDSDSEAMLVDQAWRGDGDSDAESIDSEQEDPLKHAGVYTAEEVALITRDKLIRLQSLYIDQFKRLQHTMREKRRQYLHTVKLERDSLGSIHAAKEDPEQRETYEELIAMKRYHRRFGKEALLHRQSKERRIAVSEGPNYRAPVYPKCSHSQDGIRCGARTVPLSKHCLHHILNDPHQVLYQACSYGDGICTRPGLALRDSPQCVLHRGLADFKPHQDQDKPRQPSATTQSEDFGVTVGSAGRAIDVVNVSSPMDVLSDPRLLLAAMPPNGGQRYLLTAPPDAHIDSTHNPTLSSSSVPQPSASLSTPTEQ